MKKAFYLFGTLYFAIRVSGEACSLVRCLKKEFRKSTHEIKQQEAKKVRQPIGFAVERIES